MDRASFWGDISTTIAIVLCYKQALLTTILEFSSSTHMHECICNEYANDDLQSSSCSCSSSFLLFSHKNSGNHLQHEGMFTKCDICCKHWLSIYSYLVKIGMINCTFRIKRLEDKHPHMNNDKDRQLHRQLQILRICEMWNVREMCFAWAINDLLLSFMKVSWFSIISQAWLTV